MDRERSNRIYGIVALIVVLGLCIGVALGGVAGGFAGAYIANQRTAAISDNQATSGAPTPIVVQEEAAPTPAPAILSQSVSTSDTEAKVEAVYKQVNPAVVYISVAVPAQTSISPFGPFTSPDTPQYDYGSGSGFVYDREGHIVTNNHVVADAAKITVIFSDDTEAVGTVVGTDPDSDLAVIKVDPEGLTLVPVTLGDSSSLTVGQNVVAIGNPFGYAGTLTTGVISALSRSLPSTGDTSRGTYTIPDVIQTDAAINPGNSGGPLLNLQGRVVGVNAAIESSVQSSSGVGFSIPVNLVKMIVPTLIDEGKYVYPYLGISGGTLYPDVAQAMGLPKTQRGALVATVTEGGPAANAGILPSTEETTIDGAQVPIGGDVIIAVDGNPVNNFDDLLVQLVYNYKPGDQARITILRGGKTQTLSVTLSSRPAS